MIVTRGCGRGKLGSIAAFGLSKRLSNVVIDFPEIDAYSLIFNHKEYNLSKIDLVAYIEYDVYETFLKNNNEIALLKALNNFTSLEDRNPDILFKLQDFGIPFLKLKNLESTVREI